MSSSSSSSSSSYQSSSSTGSPAVSDVIGTDEIDYYVTYDDEANSYIMSMSSTFKKTLKSGFTNLRHDSSFSDVRLKVGDKYIHCHKIILCMFSGYFKGMFQSGLKESHELEVTLETLSFEVVMAAIDYMYMDEINITEDNVEGILFASIYLQMESLRKRCEKKIRTFLTPDNVFLFWNLADKHKECTLLFNICMHYTLVNFKQIIDSKHFVDIDFQRLVCLLSHAKLKVSDEDTVMSGVLKWIRNERCARVSVLKEILPHVHLPLMSSAVLDQMKSEFPEIKQEPLLQYLQEAENYKRDIALQMTTTSPRTEYRPHCKKEKVLLVVGGKELVDCKYGSRTLWCFSFHSKKWRRLAPFPKSPEFGLATCTFGESKLFAFGDFGKTNMYRYNGLKNKWRKCRKSSTTLYGHCMVAAEDSLYIIGGRTHFFFETKIQETILVYNVSENKWRNGPKLRVPVINSIAVTGPEHKIYIFGGTDDDGLKTNCVQCVDIQTSTCTVLTTDRLVSGIRCATCYSGNMYVVCDDGIAGFNPADASFGRISSMMYNYKGMGMAQKGSKLMFVGGEIPLTDFDISRSDEQANASVVMSDRIVEFDLNEKTELAWDNPLDTGISNCGVHFLAMYKWWKIW